MTPADVAVWVRLRKPELLERKHAERQIPAKRSFEFFQSRDADRRFVSPTSDTLKLLEAVLDSHFDDMRRGRSAKVFIFERPEGVWILVRHGKPFRREAAVRCSSVFYQPEIFDVLRYDPDLGQLAINAETKGIGKLYRKEIGTHLFGNPEMFPVDDYYTLEPLHQDGEAALACTDIDGMEAVHLTEIRTVYGDPYHGSETLRSDDVFAFLRALGRPFPKFGVVRRAVFGVKFANARAPRPMTVAPPNVVTFTRDEDSASLERWLRKRGFVLKEECPGDAPIDSAVGDP